MAKGKNHRDILIELGRHFNLTAEEEKERLPGANQSTFGNRVGWARTYLSKAGLITSPRRGVHKITEEGSRVLASNPTNINQKFLKQYESFIAFKSSPSSEDSNLGNDDMEPINLEEEFEKKFIKLKRELAYEILDQIKKNPLHYFEHLVFELLFKMGYGRSRKDVVDFRVKPGDIGIEGIIKEDRLGFNRIYMQARHYERTVQINHVRDFAGSLLVAKVDKGLFITTSSFPKSALAYVESVEPRIVLIDGLMLANLMIDNKIVINAKENYTL